jgi:class 3 adenylate cyclase
MFSDLVGSTALSARMDPEDLREVISAYQKCVAETVQRFGGFVAKYMGDGVLVYFGYPKAHEDDAERAVRAGLELNRSLRSARRRASVRSSSEPASFLYPATSAANCREFPGLGHKCPSRTSKTNGFNSNLG